MLVNKDYVKVSQFKNKFMVTLIFLFGQALFGSVQEAI